MRRRPYQVLLYLSCLYHKEYLKFVCSQVILLDEFEKAHREVSNLLLQVFDEGHLTDSHGMTTDFRNTVIFMTSNLGSKELFQAQLKKTEMDDSSKESKDHDEVSLLAQRIVHGHFSPEFANRLDDVIVFNGLNDEALRRICHIQLNRACSVLRENHNVSLLVTDVASKLLAQWGGGSEYGARPLKRVIQNQLMTPLAVLILEVSCLL